MRVKRSDIFFKKIVVCMGLFYLCAANAMPLFLQKALDQEKEEKNPQVFSIQKYVSAHPEDGKATIALAETHYKNADFESAIQVLLDLKSRKLLDNHGVLLLGKCYYNLGDFDSLSAMISLKQDAQLSLSEQEILSVQTDALVYQQKHEEAREQYRNLLQKNAILGSAWIGLARLSVQSYELEEAKNYLKEAKKLASDEAEILFIESDIYRLSEDLQSAKTLAEKALQIKPYHVWGRIHYASLLLSLKQTDLFYQQVNWLSDHAATNPQTQFFQAVKVLQAGNLESGISILEALLKKYPNHTAGTRLLARAYYNQGQLKQAEALISPYVQTHPEDSEAVILDAVIALKMNNPNKVIQALSPFVSSITQNDRMLSLLGTAYLLTGNTEKGLSLLDSAEKVKKYQSERTQIVDGSEISDDFNVTEQLLQGVVEKKEDSAEEKILTAKKYLTQKQYDSAYQLALSLLKQDPNHAVAHDLLGQAYQGLGDQGSAMSQFKQALQLSPGLLETRYHLAMLYESKSEEGLADQEIQFILNKKPDYVPAILMKASLLEKKGEIEKARQLLEKNYFLSHPEKETAIALLKLFQSHFPSSTSYEFSKKISTQFYQDTMIQNLAAQIAYDQSDFLGAQKLYSKSQSLNPNDLASAHGLIKTYIAMGRMNQATSILNKLLEQNLGNRETVLLSADLALKTRDPYQLNQAVERVLRFDQKDPDVFRKTGDLWMALKQPKKALVAYEEGYQLSPDAKMAIFLYQLEMKEDNKHAVQRLEDWVVNHPEDVDTQHYLAQQLLNTNPKKVTQLYQQILERKPNDLVALNNLALLLSEKSPTRALSLITKGYKINKNNPKILDTYGWVLMKNKQRMEALKYFKLAFEKDDQDLEIRWHYAYGLYHNGEVDQAKEVLGKMLNDKTLQSKLSEEAKQFLFEIS